uniref:Cystathionine gamma-lyase n=1 Tax=Heterorhabditis bacteriophora TaxID=37862 RepID=A0A1I7XP63_HETBA
MLLCYHLIHSFSDSQFLPGKNEARTRLGAQFDDLHIDTKLSTSRNILLKNVDPVIVPIYHSSTYKFRNIDQWNEYNHGLNYVYQRCGNPTVENVEVIINEMEGGAATLVYSFVDATFASPYNVQPIKLGADFSMHSCSKYIGGHTDVIGGCVTVKKRENWQRLKVQQLTTGSAINVRLIGLAVSLGGTESLIEHPCSMSHGNELLRNIDEPMVSPGLIRLSSITLKTSRVMSGLWNTVANECQLDAVGGQGLLLSRLRPSKATLVRSTSCV